MKRRILIIPCAGPQGDFEGSDYLLRYLQEKLGTTYAIQFSRMPNPENPDYDSWSWQLEKELTSEDGDLLLLGHSLGGSVLLKYLSEHKLGKKIAGLFIIAAPYWGKENWEVDEFELQENFSSHLPVTDNVFLYHSKDDEVVPFEHLSYYAQKLPLAKVRPSNNNGHLYSKGAPELIEDLQNILP